MNKKTKDPAMLPEYDFSGGTRGKYAVRFATFSNIIMLEPDVAEAFPTTESVNDALRLLVKLAHQTIEKVPV